MIIFIDFDDVLFYTKKFKDDLKEVFRTHGVSNDDYIKYYFPHGDDIPKTYDPRAQIERICAYKPVAKKPLMDAVNEFLKQKTSQYLFEDVKEFFQRTRKHSVIVLSFGEKKMQHEKIANCDIGEFIADVLITEDLKSKAVADFLGRKKMEHEKMIFLDDRVEQLADMKKYFPQIRTIWVHRPEGRYQEQTKESCCDFDASSLLEAVEIINDINDNDKI